MDWIKISADLEFYIQEKYKLPLSGMKMKVSLQILQTIEKKTSGNLYEEIW